jgi:Ca2+-binding RTX toxin-like protein
LLLSPALPTADTAGPDQRDQSLNRPAVTAARAAGIDEGWIELEMPGRGAVGPFEISNEAPVALSFTDAYCAGDRMQVLDGTRVVATGSPLVLQPSCWLRREAGGAFFDRRFSSGLVLLRPGTHELRFKTLFTFTEGFGAAYRVDTCTVTEPSDGVLAGTADRDVICGTDRADVLKSGGGAADLLLGAGGGDVIGARTASGRTAISGGPGPDVIVGGPAVDKVFSGGGADTARGGLGADGLSGDAGVDLLQGLGGDDALLGGPDSDATLGGRGTDVCLHGAGTVLAKSCEISVPPRRW